MHIVHYYAVIVVISRWEFLALWCHRLIPKCIMQMFYSKKCITLFFFSLKILLTILHNGNMNNFFCFANSWKIENKAIPCTWVFEAFVETSKIKLRCFLFPLMMFLFDWSPPVCDKPSWLDVMWKGIHTPVCIQYSWHAAHVRAKNRAMKSQGLCVVSQGISSIHQCTFTIVKPSWSPLTKVLFIVHCGSCNTIPRTGLNPEGSLPNPTVSYQW